MKALVAMFAFFFVLATDAHFTECRAADEVWRLDTTHLESDKEHARTCLSQDNPSALDSCVHVIGRRCIAAVDPDAISHAHSRLCAWREIAAWEDLVAERLHSLEERVAAVGASDELLGISQSAWEASMIADTRLAAGPYEGGWGSFGGMVAATTRAEATARRAIWLERLIRSIAP